MKKILGAAIGTCVHIGGLSHFLKLAESEGYISSLLGPAISIEHIIDAIRQQRPDILALSYRLTPEVAANLFKELEQALKENNFHETKLIF